MDKLFTDVGKKIQKFAKLYTLFSFIIGGIAVFVGLIMVFDSPAGLIVIGSGIFFAIQALIVSWFLYAFGQISEDIHNMAQPVADDDEIPDL